MSNTFGQLKREALREAENLTSENTNEPTMTTTTARTPEDLRARNAAYQRRWREKNKEAQQIAREAEDPHVIKSTPELEKLYERREDLEIELDYVNAGIRWHEHKNREER